MTRRGDWMNVQAPRPAPEAIEGDLLADTVAALPSRARMIDYGCLGWRAARLAAAIGRGDLEQFGVDLGAEPAGRPPAARFLTLAAPGAGLPALEADLLVASHVLEHCTDPVAIFATWLHAVRPGGRIYVEAPSDRAALPCSSDDAEDHAFGNFWDDPTHVRPWPAAALYRLALSWGAVPERCLHAVRGGIHCGVALIRRVDAAPPRYRYISLRDVPPGLAHALAHAGIDPPRTTPPSLTLTPP